MKKFKIKLSGIKLLICIVLTLVFSISCGKCCAEAAFLQGSKHLPEYDKTLTSKGYEFIPKDEKSIQAMDDKLVANSNFYAGYISSKAKLDTKVNGDNKLSQSVILLSDTLKKERLTNKTYNGEIEEGYYPIYVEGFRWKKFKAGDKVSFELNDKSGNTQKINAIICGDFFGERLPVLLEGYDFLKTGSGVFAVDGLDISNYVDEPYEKITLINFTNINLEEFGTVFFDHEISRISADIFFAQPNEEAFIKNPILKLCVLLVIFFATILLLGGKYRSYFFVGFGAISFIVSLLYANKTYVTNILFSGISYYFYQWLYWLSFGVLGICVLMFAVLFILEYKKYKKLKHIGEQINANTPKYL